MKEKADKTQEIKELKSLLDQTTKRNTELEASLRKEKFVNKRDFTTFEELQGDCGNQQIKGLNGLPSSKNKRSPTNQSGVTTTSEDSLDKKRFCSGSIKNSQQVEITTNKTSPIPN